MLNFDELDFTIDKFRQICSSIVDSGYPVITMKEYLSADFEKPDSFAIIRHDIDELPKTGLRTALIEKNLGIRATYYFRTKNNVFQPDIIKEISDMGHEIGYHYENLSTAHGDYEKAIKLFEDDLVRFRDICELKTICMHGASLSKYDNRDLWNVYKLGDFGLLGEAYLSVGHELNYFTDTGRGWNSKNNLRDYIPGKKDNISVDTTENLIKLISSRQIDYIYINLHPNRWTTNVYNWSYFWLQDFAFNSVKKILRRMRN